MTIMRPTLYIQYNFWVHEMERMQLIRFFCHIFLKVWIIWCYQVVCLVLKSLIFFVFIMYLHLKLLHANDKFFVLFLLNLDSMEMKTKTLKILHPSYRVVFYDSNLNKENCELGLGDMCTRVQYECWKITVSNFKRGNF